MKIALACDHGGYVLRDYIRETIVANGGEVIDLGTDTTDSVDYPDYAFKALDLLSSNGCDRAVLVCGTGIGMSICANRITGVRGALCHDAYTARMSRQHNDSNCLVLGARVVGSAVAQDIVEIWLQTPFEGGRHQDRLDKIERFAQKVQKESM